MQLTLALPVLFDGPADELAALPALAELIALAGAPERQRGGLSVALAARYGVARQSDWPLAPIRLAALGLPPGDAYWLAADPVTVEVGHATAELAGIVDDLDRVEADALLTTLNAHFSSDGLVFVAPRPDRLFVRTETATRLSTVMTRAALRRPLRPLLPQGLDAILWRRWQSEIEMLFHEHPVNVERERTGRALVSSLWLSEGGTLPPRPGVRIATFCANGIASALAAFIGSPSRSLPAELRAARADAGPAESIVVAIDSTLEMADVERAWAAPALAALAAGSFNEVQLIGEDDGDAVIWHVRRPGLWRRIAGRFQTHDLRALVNAARHSE